jgi:hypothetical protein|tara:strand:- start:1913 stop:2689 length:777 start_codon:yes stop_codon:yes gene_type:complete
MASNVTKKKNDSNVVEFDASIFEADAGKGLENVGQDDLALPFIKILSGLDPVLDDLEEARKGDIYNTVTNQIYKGKEGIKVVPCTYQRRFIEWAPRGSGTGAPLNIFTPHDTRPKTERSPDDNREYVVGGDGSYIEETHQHFVVILEEDGSSSTALIAMKSTQLKKSRKWNSMIASRSLVGKNGPFTPPRYSHVYLLKTVSEENSKGSWHGWDISLVEQVKEMALYGAAKAFAENISSGEVEVKHSQETTESADNAPF